MKKLSILSNIIFGVFLIILCVIVLPIFFKSLRYNFINGGGNLTSSTSKEESIERGVYVCDLVLSSFKKSGDPVDFKVKEAWIEIVWRDGAWYWTTTKQNIGYSIIVKTNLAEEDEDKINITNNKKSAIGDFEGLGCRNGYCEGTIITIPPSDTIKFNLLKKDNIDFSSDNIIGEISFLVKRK